MAKILFNRKFSEKYNLSLEFKLEDLWIGLFWKKSDNRVDFWLCLIPCFPLHLTVFYI